MSGGIVEIDLDMHKIHQMGSRLATIEAEFGRELQTEMKTVMARAQRTAVANAKHDTGDLRRHITSEVENLPNGAKGTLGSNAPHAAAIEESRREDKKWPPPGALLAWMARKGIPVSERKLKGARRLRSEDGSVTGFSTRVKKTKGYYPIEYLIARKIGKKGFEGDHNMRKAVEGQREFAAERFRLVGPRVIRRMIKEAGGS